MKTIHPQQLRLAVCLLAFVLMVAVPLIVFPAVGFFPRFLPDMLAFTGVGLWGLMTVSQPETKPGEITVDSFGMLMFFWALWIAAQHALGVISTSVEFTLLGIGYLLTAGTMGALVRIWVKAGFEHELLQSFLLAVWVVAMLNAVVILIQASPWVDLFVPLIDKGSSDRPGGIISQPNIAGTWCACGLVSLVFLSNTDQGVAAKLSVWRIIAMVVLLLAINITQSRIVLIEVLALSVLYWHFRKTFRIPLWWVWLPVWQALLHVLTKAFASSGQLGIYERLGESNVSRWNIYQGTLDTIQAHPLWGIGWRQFQLVQISQPDIGGMLDHSHNLFLQIQLELGLAGSLALCVFLVYWALQKHLWQSTRPAAVVGLSVAVLFGLHSMSEYPLWYAPSLFAFAVALALIDLPPIAKFSPNTLHLKGGFAIYLAVLLWIYVDHDLAFERTVKFMLNPMATEEAAADSFWFRIYDDYVELNQTELTPTNYQNFEKKTFHLANFLTPAIPFHALLKVYVFGQQNDKAQGLAHRMCQINPELWNHLVASEIARPSSGLKDWLLAQKDDVIFCKTHPQP